MTDLVKLTIDGKEIEVPKGTSILQACEMAEIQVPRFCYHARLSIAGNCRMCLVELDGAPKPVASCAFPVAEGQVVRTQSQIAKDARKDVMEFLLANHPLDCPLCDQGGECDLQDFSMGCGSDKGEFTLEKRTVNNPDLGPYVETFMNRCIHCMRCVRFSDEIAGKNEIGGLFRGGDKIITNAENGHVTSNLSGNMIDLCPVGALTNKTAKYTYRTWELTKNKTVDVLDSILPSIYLDTKDNKIIRVRARENEAINQEWISDLTRFSYDGILNNRIKTPLVAKQEVSWEKAFDEILEDLHEINPNNICSLVGSNLAVEDLYSFKEFITKTVGSNNIDYRDNNFSLTEFNKANVTFETSIKEIDSADLILFIGTDLEQQSPVLNSRIFQQTRVRDLKVFNIGNELNYSYKINNLSKSPNVLLEDIKGFDSAIKKAKNAIVFVNVDSVLTRTDSDGILTALDNLKQNYGAKINFYTEKSGFINAVDILNNETDKNYKQIIKDLEKDSVELLFVYGDVKIDAEIARKAKKLVYIGTHNNDVSNIADIVLPSVTHVEKNSLWNNVEGRVIEVKSSIMPLYESRIDWKIWRALSQFVGNPLEFNNLNDLRLEIASKNLSYLTENIGVITKSNTFVVTNSSKINKKELELKEKTLQNSIGIIVNSNNYKKI